MHATQLATIRLPGPRSSGATSLEEALLRRRSLREVGAAAQNVALQAVALGLGTAVVGAFDDAAVAQAVGLAPEERPLAILPVGRE
jgi:nitroreductase